MNLEVLNEKIPSRDELSVNLINYDFEKKDNNQRKMLWINDFINIFRESWKDYFRRLPERAIINSQNYQEYCIMSAKYIWERILFGNDITDDSDRIYIINKFVKYFFALPEKTINWYSGAQYGDYNRLVDRVKKFDRTDHYRRKIYEVAFDIYKDNIRKKKTYTYRRALEDANENEQIISKDKFDLEFYNIEQGFKVWRKNNMSKL